MQKQTSPSAKKDRAVPTRSAVIALLLLNAILLIAPLLVRWQSWFVFAYIPLLFTVSWGMMLGGIWKWPVVILFSLPLLAFVTIGITLLLPGHNLDRLGYALVGGEVVFIGMLIITTGFAIRGWVRFFCGIN